MPTPRSNKQIQSAYKDRMRAAGYVQVTVWIKKSKVVELKEHVGRLNNEK